MDRIVEKIITLLEESDSFLVTLDWLKEKLAEGSVDVPSERQLLALLRADSRVRVFETDILNNDEEVDWVTSPKQLKELGLVGGPRIMLKTRVPSKSEIIRFLQEKANQTYAALLKAWEIRPRDEATEDQLLQALAKAQKLQRELRTIKNREETEITRDEKK